MFSHELRQRYRTLILEIDEAITNTIIWTKDGRLHASVQTEEIKACLRRIGKAHGYRVVASKEPREFLWDMVWLGEDGDGDIIEVPLACEIELASTQAAIDEDFRKLLLSNAAMKVLVCRTEHLFDLNTPLDKMARAGLIHEGTFGMWLTSAYPDGLGKHVPGKLSGSIGKKAGFTNILNEWKSATAN